LRRKPLSPAINPTVPGLQARNPEKRTDT
jgi:hypothetical protein